MSVVAPKGVLQQNGKVQTLPYFARLAIAVPPVTGERSLERWLRM